MKAKKLLRIMKLMCSEGNCEPGKCPLAIKRGDNGSGCLINDDTPDEWDVNKIVKKVKRKWREC